MNKVKYQIFISSTYEDLKEERDQVIKACLEMGHIPVGMEMFSAADEEQWKIITRQIDDSDYYVIIVANRYGSVVDGISYTEKEYDYAIAKGVPVLGFVLNADAAWPSNRHETSEDARLKLEDFKKKVRLKPVGFWSNKDDLHGRCVIALTKAFNAHPRPGWVRSSDTIGPEVATAIARLSEENKKLREQNENLQKVDSGTSYEKIYTLLSNTTLKEEELPPSIAEVLTKIAHKLGDAKINQVYMFWFVSIRLREGIISYSNSNNNLILWSSDQDNMEIMPYVYFFEELGLVSRTHTNEPTKSSGFATVKYIFLLSEEGKQFLIKLRLNGVIKRIEDASDDDNQV